MCECMGHLEEKDTKDVIWTVGSGVRVWAAHSARKGEGVVCMGRQESESKNTRNVIWRVGSDVRVRAWACMGACGGHLSALPEDLGRDELAHLHVLDAGGVARLGKTGVGGYSYQHRCHGM